MIVELPSDVLFSSGSIDLSEGGKAAVADVGSIFVIVSVLPWNDPAVKDGPFSAVLDTLRVPVDGRTDIWDQRAEVELGRVHACPSLVGEVALGEAMHGSREFFPQHRLVFDAHI